MDNFDLIDLTRRRREAQEKLDELKRKPRGWMKDYDNDQHDALIVEAERVLLAAELAIDHYRRTGTFMEEQCQ